MAGQRSHGLEIGLVPVAPAGLESYAADIVAAPSSPTHSDEADNQQGAEPMTAIQTGSSNGPNQRFCLNGINMPL